MEYKAVRLDVYVKDEREEERKDEHLKATTDILQIVLKVQSLEKFYF